MLQRRFTRLLDAPSAPSILAGLSGFMGSIGFGAWRLFIPLAIRQHVAVDAVAGMVLVESGGLADAEATC
jgi:hypothetical protein